MADNPTKTDSAPKSDAKSSTKSSDAAPANYSRGEGQKLVTQAYRDNWLAIFGKPVRKPQPKRKAAAKTRKTTAKTKTAAKTRAKRR